MTEILNGKVLAKTVRAKAKQRVEAMEFPPGLAVILIGENPASQLYVSLKETAAREVGIYIERIEYPSDVATEDVIAKIHELNERKDINGILVQLPLPGGQDTDAIISAIAPIKDIDGFHSENRRLLLANMPNLVPPTTLSIMRLIQATHLPLKGKNAVILGNSKIFAEPIIELLRDAGVVATFVPKDTEGLAAITRAADILVVAVGIPNFVTPDMTKSSAVVLDVGANKSGDKTIGDVSPDVVGHVGFLSPVPGGVGPLTVAYLLFNVIKAMELQERLRG